MKGPHEATHVGLEEMMVTIDKFQKFNDNTRRCQGPQRL